MTEQNQSQQPMRAVLYARAAIDPTGTSIIRQEQYCREFAAEHGIEITGAFADVGPAPTPGKLPPGYRRMLERAADTAARVLIVEDHARLSRSSTDIPVLRQGLRDRGLVLRFASEPDCLDDGSLTVHTIQDLIAYLDASGTRGSDCHGRV
ncbi:recombinase family protein [Glycomyces sp. NPDC047369]